MDLQTAYKKEVFAQYNRAKGAAKRGHLDKGRVNRALGLVMSNQFTNKIDEYGTTMRSCYCPDMEMRGGFCKHRLAFIMNYRAIQKIQEQIASGEVDVVLAY